MKRESVVALTLQYLLWKMKTGREAQVIYYVYRLGRAMIQYSGAAAGVRLSLNAQAWFFVKE